MSGSRHRIRGMGLSTALMVLSLFSSLPVFGEPEAATPAGAAALPGATADPALATLELHLDQLLRGNLREEIAVTGLFTVSLDDEAAVAAKASELASQNEVAKNQLAEMRRRIATLERDDVGVPSATILTPATEAEPDESAPNEEAEAARERENDRIAEPTQQRTQLESEYADAQLRLSISTKRLVYLEALQDHLARMTDAARRMLPTLGEPREGLRHHAAGLAELGGSIDELATRLEQLAKRSESGRLVGFVSAQRALVRDFSNAVAAHQRQSQRLAEVTAKQLELARTSEADARAVRSRFLRSVVAADGQASLDRLFITHLEAQRRLRRSTSDSLVAPGMRSIEQLRSEAEGMAVNPRAIGTTEDGRHVVDASVEQRQAVAALVAAEHASMAGWSLAFENELVTVLSDQASPEARESAYRQSSELFDDIASELELARARVVEGVEALWETFPSAGALFSKSGGIQILTRAGALLLIVLGWVLVRRQTPRITVWLVRNLARLRMFRGRVGLLVRWSGLVQSVLPTLTGLVALYIALQSLPEGPIRQGLRALAVPLLLYVLGRRFLSGATRRITPGRPALIELEGATRARLERTYATLGLFIAAAYALDGVARITIGTGRVVDLLDRAIMAWVGVWAVWEAVRWRVPLAQRCAALATTDRADEEDAGIEYRVATWMENRSPGFILSPFAFLRVVGTPVFTFLRDLARETDLVKSFRAWQLRRRSTPASNGAAAGAAALPPEYLEAFPLHPILGEDDAKLIPRTAFVTEVTDQLARWKESRTDGSLVIVGEKGVGKTTLAAQISRRTGDIAPDRLTIAGKPTTRAEVVELLATGLGCPATRDLDELTGLLCDGPERVVLLDEVHNVFLRHVDGYAGYDALVELVNATSSNVFWILVFNSFTWQFLNESRGKVHYFRKLLQVPSWTPDELQALIKLRNRGTGFELLFDEVLLSDEKASVGGLQLVEEADGFFRLLWESSGGNPRIATRLWLSSLTPVSESTLRVGIFPEPNQTVLSDLADDLMFSLAAICQHENLSAEELAGVLNVSPGFGRFAIQFLTESGFLEAKDQGGERSTLAPNYYRAVLRSLRSKHLLFE